MLRKRVKVSSRIKSTIGSSTCLNLGVHEFLPSPCFLLFSKSVRHISTQSQPMKSRTRCCWLKRHGLSAVSFEHFKHSRLVLFPRLRCAAFQNRQNSLVGQE